MFEFARVHDLFRIRTKNNPEGYYSITCRYESFPGQCGAIVLHTFGVDLPSGAKAHDLRKEMSREFISSINSYVPKGRFFVASVIVEKAVSSAYSFLQYAGFEFMSKGKNPNSGNTIIIGQLDRRKISTKKYLGGNSE